MSHLEEPLLDDAVRLLLTTAWRERADRLSSVSCQIAQDQTRKTHDGSVGLVSRTGEYRAAGGRWWFWLEVEVRSAKEPGLAKKVLAGSYDGEFSSYLIQYPLRDLAMATLEDGDNRQIPFTPMEMLGTSFRRKPLVEYLATAQELRGEWEADLVRITMKTGRGETLSATCSANLSFAATRITCERTGQYRFIGEYLDYTEIESGLFVPSTVHEINLDLRGATDGEPTQTLHQTIQWARGGDQPSSFALELPEGTHVTDQRASSQSTVLEHDSQQQSESSEQSWAPAFGWLVMVAGIVMVSLASTRGKIKS